MSQLKKIFFLPWWMNTFWGRWLSEHWPPAMALRDALTDKNAYESAAYWMGRDCEKLTRSVGACIQSNFNEEFRRQLIDDFDSWLRSVASKERAFLKFTRRR